MKQQQRKHRGIIRVSWQFGVILAAAAIGALVFTSTAWLAEPSTSTEDADIVVYKRSNCTCCNQWIEHLQENGFTVRALNLDSTASIQEQLGVPEELRACHTAKVGDYWVEGHVPADLIERLLSEPPEGVRGLAVPGMPVGSPGMEGPNPESYSVMIVNTEGEANVYATREGAETPQSHPE